MTARAFLGALLTVLLAASTLSGAASAAEDRSPHWHRPDLPVPSTTHATRVVSLVPSVTETLFLLGAGDLVVGVTSYCDRPAAAAAKPHVAGYADVSLEALLSHKPDLVIATPSPGTRSALDRIRDRGIPLLLVYGDDLDAIAGETLAIGAAVDRRPQAQALVTTMKRRLDAARAQGEARRKVGQPPRVLLLVGTDPLVAAGPGTFGAAALQIVGVAAALPASGALWPQLSLESLAALRPGIVVVADAPGGQKSLESVLTRSFPNLSKRPRLLWAGRAILMRPNTTVVDDIDALAALVWGR